MARLFDDAVGEHLEYAADLSGDSTWTVSLWFNTDVTNINQVLFGFAQNTVNNVYYILQCTDAADVLTTSRNPTARTATATANYTANTWHHAAAVHNGDASRAAFIDGGNKGTDTFSVSWNASVNETRIGRVPTLGDHFPFSGSIAEVGLWSVALTDEEIASLGAGFSPLFIRPQSLIAYWPLIRDTDQDIVGGFDMTPINTPSISTHPPKIYLPARPFFWDLPVASGDITITPTAAKMALRTVDPAIVLGSVTISDTAEFAADTTDPAVVLGSVTISDTAELAATTTDPTTVLGSVTISDTAEMALDTTDPTTVLGSVTISDTAEFALTTTDPTVSESGGDVTVTPTAAKLAVTTTDPAVVLGSVTITPTAAQLAVTTTDPTVTTGGVNVTPTAAKFAVTTTDPTTQLGSVTISDTSEFAVTTTDPSIVLGSVTISDTAEFSLTTTDPTVTVTTAGDVTVTPAAAAFALLATRGSVLVYGSKGPQIRATSDQIPNVRGATSLTPTIRSTSNVIPTIYDTEEH